MDDGCCVPTTGRTASVSVINGTFPMLEDESSVTGGGMEEFWSTWVVTSDDGGEIVDTSTFTENKKKACDDTQTHNYNIDIPALHVIHCVVRMPFVRMARERGRLSHLRVVVVLMLFVEPRMI